MKWPEAIRNGLFYGTIVAIVYCFTAPFNCKAAEQGPDVWVSTIARSYHLDRKANYNENNLGVGLEIPLNSSLRIVGGEYNNSIRAHSNYLGLTFTPFKLTQHLKFGGTAVVVTGYSVSPAIAPMLTLMYEREHWGINLLTIGTVSALQVKVGW